MNIIGQIILSAVFSVIGTIAAFNTPLDVIEKFDFSNQEHRLGSTITTILGTDTLSASRSTINTNFSNLNSTKIENSTTSVASITTLSNLVTVGTITSGTWQGTGIDVARQGTGTTSPSLNRVILGYGASGFKVATTGTDGQLLGLSSGVPVWQSASFDTAVSYNLTGNWGFQLGASTTRLTASSTPTNPLTLNGLAFSTPSVRGASSTLLYDNGSGVLIFDREGWAELASLRATGSVAGLRVSQFATSTHLKIVLQIPGGTSIVPIIRFNNDSASVYDYKSYTDFVSTGGQTNDDKMQVDGAGTATTSSQYLSFEGNNQVTDEKQFRLSGVLQSGALVPQVIDGAYSYGNTAQLINTVHVFVNSNTFPENTLLTVYGKRN